ncbi:MAG: proteasome accessory factor PafA2 family protein [Chthonomonadales bacterium]|nr:proteasome accessory factor PafA2 family protein [Chthonomonadales bacterium]
MPRRVFGLETEFGCLVRDPDLGDPEEVVEMVKDAAFERRKLGVLDIHSRDYAFEPAGAGGFLTNGGRLYIDAVGSHEEYATPECCSLDDLIVYDRAGRELLQSLLDDLELQEVVSFHNNSVDHFGGHTFGCHENYLVRTDDETFAAMIAALLPFLVTRQIFAGTGRVGGHRLTRPDSRSNIMTMSDHDVDFVWVSNFYGVEIDRNVDFQLSQRADHIVRTVSSRVRFNRAIINPKWDGFFTYQGRHRLHLLFGESNMSEYATMLKVGTTSLVLDLIEDNLAPDDLDIAEPLWTLRTISRDPEWRWLVPLTSGETIPAVDLQRRYLSAAQRYYTGRDAETDRVLAEWERTLDDLERDPLSTSDRLDWSAKRVLYERFIESEGVSWQDDIMHSLDLEYHNVNIAQSLYGGLEASGSIQRVTTDSQIARAMVEPPSNTRAQARGRIVEALIQRPHIRYIVDWDAVFVEPRRQITMRDPFFPYAREAASFIASMPSSGSYSGRRRSRRFDITE